MHEGKLTRRQLQEWVRIRYYYQTRIPIKDALIVSKSEDPAFRRRWIHRLHDHDGDDAGSHGCADQHAFAIGDQPFDDALGRSDRIEIGRHGEAF
jgi:coenzyme PQQ biosynthesis protein C